MKSIFTLSALALLTTINLTPVQATATNTTLAPATAGNLTGKVVETMDLSVSTNLGEDGPSNKQIIVRTTDNDHERWKLASQKEGKSMSQFIRDTINCLRSYYVLDSVIKHIIHLIYAP